VLEAMTAANFDTCLRRLLVHEGGYSNHPSDPGGPTNFGITIEDYRKYVKRDATADDVRAMRLDEAKAIYKSKYWIVQRCDALPAGLDYTIFDYGVNSGVARSGRVLRRVLGLPDNIAATTDDVLRAIDTRDIHTLIAAINDERLRFLRALRTWPVFGAGWGRRVAEVRTASIQMADVSATTSEPSAPRATPGTNAKAEVPISARAKKGTAGTIVVAGTTAAQQAHHGGAQPVFIAAIVIVTIILALGVWFAWRWHQRRRQLARI
jgi:lysozyme family protein